MNWIEVKHTPPPIREWVLGWEESRGVHVCVLLASGRFRTESDLEVDITHWIALPEGPKEAK